MMTSEVVLKGLSSLKNICLWLTSIQVSLVAQRVKHLHLPHWRETRFNPCIRGRSPGEGNGNPLQYSCLENPTDGEAWQATVHVVAKSRTQLSDFTFPFMQFGNFRGNLMLSQTF